MYGPDPVKADGRGLRVDYSNPVAETAHVMSTPNRGEQVRGWTRISAGAALIVTLILLLFGGREVRIVASEPGPFPPVTEGRTAVGNPVLLTPGRYRARVVVERVSAPSWPASPTSEIARVAFASVGAGEARDVFGFRPFDFARQKTRVVQFTVRGRSESRRQWMWQETEGLSGIRIIEARVTRETLFGVSSVGGALRGDAARHILPVVAVLAALLAAYLLLAGRVERSRPHAGVASLTLFGLLGYGAAGLALYCLLLTSGRGGAAGADGGWCWFPPLEPIAPPSAALLAVAGVAAAVAFLFSVRRHPALVWTLPVAALGLHYAGTLVGPKSDFQVYYHAGLALWAGGDPYAIRPERVLNPPPFVLACGLLPALHVPAAGFLWFGVKAAAAGWCLPFARLGLTACGATAPGPRAPRLGGTRGWQSSRWLRPEFLALFASARLIGMDLQFGNTNVLVLLALLAAAAAWAYGRTGRAAAALIGGVALKATPAIAIVGAGLSGRWRWAASALLISLAVVALSSVALELRAPGAGWGFLREAPPRPGDLSMGRVDNQSLRGMTDRMIGGAEIETKTVRSVPSLRLGAPAARAVEAILALAVLGVVALLARRAARSALPSAEGVYAWASLWAGATLAILLLSPGSWTVHFALLYLPLVVLAGRVLRGDRFAGAAFAFVALITVLPATARAISDFCTAWSSLTLASVVSLAALIRPEPAS